MAAYIVPIRSVKGYLKEFGFEAIGKYHAKPEIVKQQILDAFQKEVFGQLTMKFHDPAILSKTETEVSPAVKEQVDNILNNSIRKWKRLCIEFAKYKETYNLLHEDDLMLTLQDIVDAQGSEEVEEDVVVTDE